MLQIRKKGRKREENGDQIINRKNRPRRRVGDRDHVGDWLYISASGLVLLAGLAIFLYPDIAPHVQKYQGIRQREDFNLELFSEETEESEEKGSKEEGSDETDEEGRDGAEYIEETGSESAAYAGRAEDLSTSWSLSLRSDLEAYNRFLFTDGQTDFRDALSVTQIPECLADREDEMFGYLEIPAMDLTLPLYIGATDDHMAKGAAVLGFTSLPLGGANTNSVIAGHRGYRGMPYFREIEKLTVGDPVYVTNPWGHLCYRVESIDIIGPSDSDKVKIQAGRDMITLLTCHPYRSHGKYRYVVYCVRDPSWSGTREDEENDPDTAETTGRTEIVASDGTVYASSEGDIQREKYFRRGCAVLILLMVGKTVRRKRREVDDAD